MSRVVSRRTAPAAMVLALALAFGCASRQDSTRQDGGSGAHATSEEQQPHRRPQPGNDPIRNGSRAELRLTALGDASRDQVRLRLEIRNLGAEPFVWDREFSAFMDWQVRTGEGTPVELATIRDLERNDAVDLNSRFVAVNPGESLAKEFDLATGFRRFVYGRGIVVPEQGEPYTIPNAYEELAQVRVPGEITAIEVHAEYHGIPVAGAEPFMSLWGKSPLELELLNEQLRTRKVSIRFGGKTPP